MKGWAKENTELTMQMGQWMASHNERGDRDGMGDCLLCSVSLIYIYVNIYLIHTAHQGIICH
jgi:hypothetical protein